MKFKKTLSAVLAGLMLVGGAVATSAATVYTAEDFCTPVYKIPGYTLGNYYNGYFYNWIYDSKDPILEAVWNPVTGRYDYCACDYCTGKVTDGYYWVNGVCYTYKDYYLNCVPHYTPAVTPSTTVTVKPVETPVAENNNGAGTAYLENRIPSALIKRKKTTTTTAGNVTTGSGNVTITPNGNVSVKNPAIIGSINNCVTIPGGKYYPYDKIDLNAFFKNNSYGVYMYVGDSQTFGTGFKMISSNSNVAKIVNDDKGQNIVATGIGSAEVYLYTAGGVPFMCLNVYVSGKAYNTTTGYIDVQVGEWNLSGIGDSTDVVLKADKEYTDIVVDVLKGSGYLKDGKLYATGTGAMVLKAYSKSNPNVAGYAVVYVGEYVNALYEGYWTNVNGGISCDYWNPNLWGCDGYKINGWVVANGVYLPVISKVETTTTKPDGTTSSTTTTIYSDVYDLLYGDCYGDVDTLYKALWQKYLLTGKPVESFSTTYQKALEEIMADIADNYYDQLH